MRCRDTAAPTTASTYRTRILLSLKRAQETRRGEPSQSSPGGANELETDENVEEGQGERDEERTKKTRRRGRGRGERLQGQMVQRSYHCLPSDSDKFTIKLHSFPSKCPSSVRVRFILLRSSRGRASCLDRILRFSRRAGPRRSTLASDDNHNSLRTRAKSSTSFFTSSSYGLASLRSTEPSFLVFSPATLSRNPSPPSCFPIFDSGWTLKFAESFLMPPSSIRSNEMLGSCSFESWFVRYH